MISTTRRWLRRNRTNFAIGAGVFGVGYIAGQYVISKISETQERWNTDRVAKENLRRRFHQNQEDCTFTVLALLPTATENILEALPVESLTNELQQKKAERLGRSEGGISDPSSATSGGPNATDDGKSLSSFQSESYVHASQMGASSSGSGEGPKRSKAQLWNELKINSITRSFTLLYTLSLLTLLTRIQLNLLGRRNYLSSIVSLASHPSQEPTISLENHDDDNVAQAYGNDFETNRKFLTFSWWLLHRGWRDIMQKVEAAVKEVFGPLNPREDIQLDRLSALVLDVRRKVEGETPEERKSQRWLPYLLPPPHSEDLVLRESGTIPSPPTSASLASPPTSPSPSPSTPPLRRLLDETSDLIDSPPFSQVLTHTLDSTFSHLTDTKLRTQAYKLPPLNLNPSTTEPRITDITSTPEKAKLATILAVITKQARAIGAGLPNEYVQAMEGVRELEAFGAVVFSERFEDDVRPSTPVEVSGVEGREEGSGGSEVEVGRERGIGGGTGEKEAGLEPKEGGIADKAWRGFEGVWGRVVGWKGVDEGEGPGMTG